MWQIDVACFIKKAGLDNHKSPICELKLPEGICASHSFSTAKTVEGLTTLLSPWLSVDMQAEFVLLLFSVFLHILTHKTL